MSIDRRTFVAGAGLVGALSPGIAAAADVVRIPIRLTDTRVLVDCAIGDHGPYGFVLDTGGTIGLLDLDLAKALKLKQLGMSMLGLKSGKMLYPIFAANDLSFGGQIRQPVSAIAGIAHFNFGDGAVGSLAAGSLTAVDGEIDYDALEWRIYRGGAPDRAGWTRYTDAIVHRGNMNGSAFLYGDVLINGRTFRVGLDTGTPTAMHLYRKAAVAAGVWDAPRWTPAPPGGKGRMVRLAVALGGSTIDDALITLVDDPEYAFFDNGVVGLQILRRFNMATDAANKALYLKRNALPAVHERYNRAGLWIDRAGADAKVAVVGAGSPAAALDIRSGDRLVGADFATLTRRMVAPAGTVIPLKVERGGVQRQVDLTLADFL